MYLSRALDSAQIYSIKMQQGNLQISGINSQSYISIFNQCTMNCDIRQKYI
jgi:Tfp pilus assembly protein PilN